MEGWEKHYPGMIEWQDPKMHGGIKGVDAQTGEIKTDLATYKAALANIIPAQMAGKIARDAGLANESGFCPIDPENMKSKIDANIYVDRRRLHSRRHAEVGVLRQQPGQGRGDGDPRRTDQFAHVPGALFQHLLEPDRDRRRHFRQRHLRAGRRQDQAGDDRREPEGRSADVRKQNYAASIDWYNGITSEIFG